MSKTAQHSAPDMHPDHSAKVTRIKRIEGQIAGIRRMVEERRYCTDIIAQTRAVAAALKSLEAEILKSHLEHCVSAALSSDDEKARRDSIDEIMTLFKKS